MISYTTDQFWEAYGRLDEQTKKRARKAYRLFEDNPNHSSLEFKKIHPSQPVYSARVTLDHRGSAYGTGTRLCGYGSVRTTSTNDSSRASKNVGRNPSSLQPTMGECRFQRVSYPSFCSCDFPPIAAEFCRCADCSHLPSGKGRPRALHTAKTLPTGCRSYATARSIAASEEITCTPASFISSQAWAREPS